MAIPAPPEAYLGGFAWQPSQARSVPEVQAGVVDVGRAPACPLEWQ